MKIKDLPKPIRKWAKKNEKKFKFKIKGDPFPGLLTNFYWRLTKEGVDFWHDVSSGLTVSYLKANYPNLPWPTEEKEPDAFEEHLKETIAKLEGWGDNLESKNHSLKNYKEILTRYEEFKK